MPFELISPRFWSFPLGHRLRLSRRVLPRSAVLLPITRPVLRRCRKRCTASWPAQLDVVAHGDCSLRQRDDLRSAPAMASMLALRLGQVIAGVRNAGAGSLIGIAETCLIIAYSRGLPDAPRRCRSGNRYSSASCSAAEAPSRGSVSRPQLLSSRSARSGGSRCAASRNSFRLKQAAQLVNLSDHRASGQLQHSSAPRFGVSSISPLVLLTRISAFPADRGPADAVERCQRPLPQPASRLGAVRPRG